MSLQKISFEVGFISDVAEWMRESEGVAIQAETIERLDSEEFLSPINQIATDRINAWSFNSSRQYDALKKLLAPLGLSASEQRDAVQLIEIVLDTGAGLSAGRRRHKEDMTLGARLVSPCQELMRSPASRPLKPRDWESRWVECGGKLYQGRMVALVDDPVWSKISRFGCPYPPFDYNSGMITMPMLRADAVALGVIEDDFSPE